MSLFNASNKTSGPWPLVVASKFINWSIKQEKIEFNERVRVSPEEDALGNWIIIYFRMKTFISSGKSSLNFHQ